MNAIYHFPEDRCLVELEGMEGRTLCGLAVPVQPAKAGVLDIGRVLEVGPDVKELVVGDRVLCAAAAGHRFTADGKQIILKEDKILAKAS